MTHNTYRIVESYNEPMRRTIFYVWENTMILSVYQTRQEAEESIKKNIKADPRYNQREA